VGGLRGSADTYLLLLWGAWNRGANEVTCHFLQDGWQKLLPKDSLAWFSQDLKMTSIYGEYEKPSLHLWGAQDEFFHLCMVCNTQLIGEKSQFLFPGQGLYLSCFSESPDLQNWLGSVSTSLTSFSSLMATGRYLLKFYIIYHDWQQRLEEIPLYLPIRAQDPFQVGQRNSSWDLG
jgi:hypothetical protein